MSKRKSSKLVTTLNPLNIFPAELWENIADRLETVVNIRNFSEAFEEFDIYFPDVNESITLDNAFPKTILLENDPNDNTLHLQQLKLKRWGFINSLRPTLELQQSSWLSKFKPNYVKLTTAEEIQNLHQHILSCGIHLLNGNILNIEKKGISSPDYKRRLADMEKGNRLLDSLRAFLEDFGNKILRIELRFGKLATTNFEEVQCTLQKIIMCLYLLPNLQDLVFGVDFDETYVPGARSVFSQCFVYPSFPLLENLTVLNAQYCGAEICKYFKRGYPNIKKLRACQPFYLSKTSFPNLLEFVTTSRYLSYFSNSQIFCRSEIKSILSTTSTDANEARQIKPFLHAIRSSNIQELCINKHRTCLPNVKLDMVQSVETLSLFDETHLGFDFLVYLPNLKRLFVRISSRLPNGFFKREQTELNYGIHTQTIRHILYNVEGNLEKGSNIWKLFPYLELLCIDENERLRCYTKVRDGAAYIIPF